MQIEAGDLRLADVVRLGGGEGEREIIKIEKNGAARVWFRGDDPNEDANKVYPLWQSVEIARPGDLFAAEKPPKTVEEGRERIIQRMEALGWSVRRRGFGAVNDYVTDPTDTVRLKLKTQALALQLRWFDRGAWRWHPNPQSLGQIKAYATNLDENVAKLLRVAENRARERFEVDQRRIAAAPASSGAAEPSSAESSAASEAEPVVVRYSYDQGVLLGGATKAHKELIKALRNPYRLRYSRNLPGDAAWYVPRSRNTEQPRERVEQLGEALRARGVPVLVEYTEPQESEAWQRLERIRSRRAKRSSASTPAATPAPAPASAATRSTPAPPKRGRPPNNTKRAAKLRKLADKLEAKGNENLAAERLENTPRRARMAADARKAARRQIVMGQTIRRAADAVEQGQLDHVARISNAAEIEALELELRRAMWARNRRLGRPSDDEREPEEEDIGDATYPHPIATPTALRDTVKASEGLPDLDAERRRIAELGEMKVDTVTLSNADTDALRALIRAIRRDEGRKLPYSASAVDETIKEHDRLARLGVHDTPTLRSALRQYMICCRGEVKTQREDPIAAKKRELKFAKIPGYFPTPRELAERLVELAEIEPRMRVLEPSAGSGSIAEVIRERHPDARLELVEFNHRLREILQAEGYNLVGFDFTALEPVGFPYDRIIMNPPFEARQDVHHIQHALGMLASGGRLVAIASAGLEFREDAATARLRERIATLGGRIEKLPEGSFKESGTGVNAVIVVIDKPQAVTRVPPRPKAKPKLEQESELAKRWKAHLERSERPGSAGWKNLPKTSCFVRTEGDVSVTLCPAIQKFSVGACPPADFKAKNKQLMLCQVDEEVEFFPRGERAIQDAKAEADNRLVRGRQREAQASDELGPMPAADDFDGLERDLDSIVPSRIVYERGKPL